MQTKVWSKKLTDLLIETAESGEVRPAPTDFCSQWLRRIVTDKLREDGILSLADLVETMQRRGYYWYLAIRGLGEKKALAISTWLQAHEGTLGSIRAALVRPVAEPGQLVTIEPFSGTLAPLERCAVSPTVDGRMGDNRARLVVNTGSVLEDDDQLVLAHFMDHMNFNGTKRFPKNELVSYLQSIGVEFGADLNAYTSFDETVYMLPVPTDKPGLVEKGLQILEDWAHNALLDSLEIEKERGVVIEEWRLSRGAEERMMKQTLPVQYQGSKYAERLPIGKIEILQSFSHAALKRFYKDWYRPDLQAVIRSW